MRGESASLAEEMVDQRHQQLTHAKFARRSTAGGARLPYRLHFIEANELLEIFTERDIFGGCVDRHPEFLSKLLPTYHYILWFLADFSKNHNMLWFRLHFLTGIDPRRHLDANQLKVSVPRQARSFRRMADTFDGKAD